jgi:hypothetical protein
VLQILVELIATLGQLPDAVNLRAEAIVMDADGMTVRVEPGEVVELPDGRLWSALPGFDISLTEILQGMLLSYLILVFCDFVLICFLFGI